MFLGFIAVVWIATPLIYYLNVWNSQKMPLISNRVFDIDGYIYNTTRILNDDIYLNKTALEKYGN